jgi:hypothetical protein
MRIIMRLYKYYGNISYVEELIEHNTLYFSSVNEFNDPYEEIAVCRKSDDMKWRAILNIKQTASICCFSSTPFNYLMWSHYADKHTGFCIGFDIPGINFNANDYPIINVNGNDIYFLKIVYSPFQKIYNGELPSSFYGPEYLEWFSHKYSYWKYEKEIRAIIKAKNSIKIGIEKKWISKLFFGCKCNKQMEIVDLLKKYNYKIELDTVDHAFGERKIKTFAKNKYKL